WERKWGDHGAVIAVKILPGPDLVAFRNSLFSSLEKLVIPDPEANRTHEDFWYHCTMVLNVSEERCREIWTTLIDDGSMRERMQAEDECPDLIRSLHFPLESIRVTLLKYNVIRGEYDLATGRVLVRNQTLLPAVWQESLKAYRRERGFDPLAPKQKRISEIYLSADTHFGHANIIRYCARPFHPLRAEEMDETLIRNWNAVVGTMDRVYFLGDLCYGLTSGSPIDYLTELHGKITVIRGNHDDALPETIEKTTITQDGMRFLLVHDPDPWVGAFDGWVIHGHHHNNDLLTYPFINFERKTVNVSVEVTGYRPLPLREIATLIKTRTGDEGPLLIRPLPPSEDAPPVAPQPL
ncbi:MAG: hypothetical protein LUO82_03235, partial [Methanomicrobiales archaeon]|nr:hypothetical protein [Methanomicrobiales archaeon]